MSTNTLRIIFSHTKVKYNVIKYVSNYMSIIKVFFKTGMKWFSVLSLESKPITHFLVNIWKFSVGVENEIE